MKYQLTILFFLLPSLLFAQKSKNAPSDQAVTIPQPYQYENTFKGIDIETHYIEMRDGVKLAIDVYLPKNRKKVGEKLPALLHQTRYWRAPQLRWPFRLFSNGLLGRQGKMIQDIVENGYVVVNVDARGSGASYGERAYPWSMAETKDGAEVIDWIVKQDWCSGNVGSIGVSYSGTTAEFLSFNKHPNLKAVVLMYSLYDVYEDIAYPGGIFHKHFVNDWGYYNNKLDNDELPRSSFVGKLLVKGVRRVKVKNKEQTFENAVRDHQANLQVSESAEGIEYRDQIPANKKVANMDAFSPFSYAEKLNESGVAVYCYSGWYDGDYQHANIKRFLNLSNPENKLIIGPWEHGGAYNCSPGNPSESGFDHAGEFLKFFDYHLKGIDNKLYEEAPIHYFTMIEEAWKATDNWPPAIEEQTVFFSEERSLSFEAPSNETDYDRYTVDTTASTGVFSRWKSVIGKLKTPFVYPNRKEQCKKLLHYTSEPLTASIEVTGHPIVELQVRSTEPDGNFHVYLEEVLPNGDVVLITEGLLRGIHRKITDGFPLYRDAVPQRTYYEKDAQPMIPGEKNTLRFDLLPTSYVIKKGNRLRVSIAGADQTHFEVMHKAIPTIDVFRGSHVVLPTMKQ